MTASENGSSFEVEEVLEKLVYFPIGLAAAVAKAAPEAAKTGKNLVEGQIKTAEFLGRMTVDYAKKRYQSPDTVVKDLGQMVAKSVGGPLGGLIEHLIESAVGTKDSVADRDAQEAEVVDESAGEKIKDTEESTPLDSVGGLENYESLTATQVIERLSSCTPTQLAEIESFELEHRRRRTVLAKLSQYRDASTEQEGLS